MAKDQTELINRCRKGDIKSYELLYNKYSRAMYHTCVHVVTRAEDAEDILQEAFMEAFTKLDRLKNTEAFGGWLKRIVINKSINHVRRNQKNWFEADETDLTNIPEELTIDETEFSEKIQTVTDAVSSLPEKYRMVINLHIFEQMDFEEIAALIGVQSSTVRVQYMRGKQKILNRVSNK